MINLLIDTGVMMDYLSERIPFADDSARLFQLGRSRSLRISATSSSFGTLFYILKKFNTKKRLIASLKGLTEIVRIIKVNEESVLNALDSDWRDFEDASQYFSAIQYKSIEAIITRNTKDYKGSSLPVLTPGEFIEARKATEF